VNALLRTINKVIRHPLDALIALNALARGTGYIFYYRLLNRRVRIRFPFKAFAPVVISGPGSVFIDRGTTANYNTFKGLSLITTAPGARISIGERCNLGGVTVRCQDAVTIGDRVMAAVSLIQDFLFPTENPGKGDGRQQRPQTASPVIIGNNVWIAAQSIILSGSEIGDDCVLAAGSVCHRFKAKEYSLIIGNPARRCLPIHQIMKLKKAL